jgi:DNA topoisomerase-1
MPSSAKLIIVESPAKGRTIAKYLGKGYKVEASQGHVRDLPKSQLGIDIDDNFSLKYITIRGRGDILSKIRKEAKNASRIYLATDPDREGEAISWHLAQILGMDERKPCRIEFHEVTKKAVQAALKVPRAINMDLVDAQQARRALDRIVGYKISPLLWAKVKKGLSAGRVQSVATRMVVKREEEIEGFIPDEYWEIAAQAHFAGSGGSFSTRLIAIDGEKCNIKNREQAEAAREKVEKGHFAIAHIKPGEKKKMPAAPFTTSSLQQEAGRKLGFTTQKTMQVVQSLYEGIELSVEGAQGLVTYIRTDSVRISQEALQALRDHITERFGEAYLPDQPHEYKGRKNAQDAHEAIRPTDIARTPVSIKASLTKDQFNLYKLIYSRFLASQMMPAIYDTLTVELNSDNAAGLRFYGEHKRFAGFTGIYEESADDEPDENGETQWPVLSGNETVSVTDVTGKQFFTQPPVRYTEASLVRALEEKGIGRPSTYAPTIVTIITRGYVSREKRRLYPTELGRMITEMMEEYFTDIVDTEFTAGLEDKLDQVEEGLTAWKDILRDFYPPFKQTLALAEQQIEKVEIKDEVSDTVCEACGAMMVYKLGRFGRFLACPNFPDCRFTKQIVTYLNVPCPLCDSRLMVKRSKKGRVFYGCESYPSCRFVSWDIPVADKCPVCGGFLVKKRGRQGETWHVCAGETCKHRIAVKEEVFDAE